MPTYARYALTLVRGEGTRVWDDRGRDYLDFAGALGVNALGHSHPAWVAAIRDQLETLDMVSNLYATETQASLADRLAALMPVADALVFFCNSGAEANEAAIKLARKHGLANGKPAMIALEGSFHGRTIAALAATGQPGKRAAFEPLVDWFRFVRPGDLDALDAGMTDEIGAVLLEPVLGEGGVLPLDDGYLRGVRALCDERGALLVADEVQSGMGRCGDWAALQHAGVEADVLTLAKALGGGLPIGAMLARTEVSFEPGDHGSTFGGGPIVCAGALAVLDTIEGDGLLARARAIGEALPFAAVAAAPEGAVLEARGRGCLWGFQLARPVANDVVLAMIDEGVLATTAGPDVVRMSPPLTSSDDDVVLAAGVFGAAVARVVAQVAPRRVPEVAEASS
ncbi:MAG: aminotransferase class III-fold pyridoxal phosphate-dependent enzyme [Actinomycetota bacterium]